MADIGLLEPLLNIVEYLGDDEMNGYPKLKVCDEVGSTSFIFEIFDALFIDCINRANCYIYIHRQSSRWAYYY